MSFKICETHVIGCVVKDLAVLDDYVSSQNVNPAALKHTSWLHQQGVGLLRNGRGSKLGVTHSIGRVAENLAGLDSYGSA